MFVHKIPLHFLSVQSCIRKWFKMLCLFGIAYLSKNGFQFYSEITILLCFWLTWVWGTYSIKSTTNTLPHKVIASKSRSSYDVKQWLRLRPYIKLYKILTWKCIIKSNQKHQELDNLVVTAQHKKDKSKSTSTSINKSIIRWHLSKLSKYRRI